MKGTMFYSWLPACVCGAVIGCGALTSRAADPGPYVNFDAGVNLVSDVETIFFIPGLGVGIGDVAFDPGFRFGVEGGYRLSDGLGLGLETGFIFNEVESIGGSAIRDVSLMHVPILANLVFRFENSSPVVPFLGIGGGATFSIFDVDTDSDTDIVPAWQGLAGLQIKLSDTMSAGLTGKYLGVSSPEFDVGGVFVEPDTIHNYSILASLNWSF